MSVNANFNFLAPLSVTETELTEGPPDAENKVYNGATSYDTDDEVWDAGHVYRSLVDSNVGNTPASSPTEWSDLGEIDQGALEYDGVISYDTGDYAVYGGALWKCAADSTVEVTPSASASEWTEQSKTNRLRPFDGFMQDEASEAGSLSYTLEFTSLVGCIAILRATGDSVNVTITDDTEGEVYNQDHALEDDSNIIDAWEYCFGDFILIDTVLIEDLPPYIGAEIKITITGETASVAQIVMGAPVSIGSVETNSSVGIESYSKKERDDFNRTYVVARPYSDTVLFNLSVLTQSVGFIRRQLAQREALATLYYMGGGALEGAVAYGFFQNFEILLKSNQVADCVLEIEGLG